MHLDDQLKTCEDVVHRDLEEGIALFNLKKKESFELDPVGARLWFALRAGQKLRSAYESILAEYDVAPDVLERDILALASELLANGVLERCDG